MATVHITLGTAQGRALTGSTLQIPDSVERAAETLTSSGSSAPSALEAQQGEIWTVVAVGGSVWAKFGAEPEAGPDAGHLIPEGVPRSFNAMASGEKVAIVDVA